MPHAVAQRSAPSIVWFRDDLRLADNPALTSAVKARRPIVCVYVFEDGSSERRPLGSASRWWLAGSLHALGKALEKRGAQLVLRRGAAGQVIPALASDIGAEAIYWNRRYDAAGQAIDSAIAEALIADDIAVETFQASLLHEPGSVLNRAGGRFGVFTAFWRRACENADPRAPLPAPKKLEGPNNIRSEKLDDWKLEPHAPDWAAGFRPHWTPGEAGAQKRLADFVDEALAGYARLRDRPDLAHTSRLSPHLRFGEVSPFQIWHSAKLALDAPRGTKPTRTDVDKLDSELGWREFCYDLLSRSPDLATRNLQSRFDAFPWRKDDEALRAWQRGRTGYPIVDASMRELWQTGWMHNRMRMVVASFLSKHLLIDWRAGESWFWDTLVDADSANNPAGWQWVAGSGVDAAPYFRVFNPVLQGEKFDPKGDYVRRFVPELAELPTKHVHAPWEAPAAVLKAAGITLGTTYPRPIVDHRAARERALSAFKTLKQP